VTLCCVWLVAGCGEPAPTDADGGDATAQNATDTTNNGASNGVSDGYAANDGAGADSAGPAPFWQPPAGGYTVLFLDVGQGDAIVVIAADGSTMLVDGGKREKILAKRLAALKLKSIDFVVATHADSDHIGALEAAFDSFDVGSVYWNGSTKDTDVFDDFLQAAKEGGAQLLVPQRGDVFKLGEVPVEVVHPGKLSGSHNDDSIVLLTGCSGAWLLLTGDAEAKAEAEMLQDYGISDVDVLKVGHHGSKSGTTQPFLDALKAKDAIISAGKQNIYNHPDSSVIERLKSSGAKVWETDVNDGDDTLMMKADCKSPYVFSRPFW
jgi:competence protein ComEC